MDPFAAYAQAAKQCLQVTSQETRSGFTKPTLPGSAAFLHQLLVYALIYGFHSGVHSLSPTCRHGTLWHWCASDFLHGGAPFSSDAVQGATALARLSLLKATTQTLHEARANAREFWGARSPLLRALHWRARRPRTVSALPAGLALHAHEKCIDRPNQRHVGFAALQAASEQEALLEMNTARKCLLQRARDLVSGAPAGGPLTPKERYRTREYQATLASLASAVSSAMQKVSKRVEKVNAFDDPTLTPSTPAAPTRHAMGWVGVTQAHQQVTVEESLSSVRGQEQLHEELLCGVLEDQAPAFRHLWAPPEVVEEEAELPERAEHSPAAAQVYFPGAATREHVLLCAGVMPPGTVVDSDFAQYLASGPTTVDSHDLPQSVELLPSLTQLFLEYCPRRAEAAHAAGQGAVRVRGAGQMQVQAFAARALHEQQGKQEVRLPEAGIRALLRDLGVYPHPLQAVDVTVLLLMTTMGCKPLLHHAKRATEATGETMPGSDACAGAKRDADVTAWDIARRSLELARSAVPFAVDLAVGRAAASRVFMSPDALSSTGQLSLNFAQFLDVLGRCAVVAQSCQHRHTRTVDMQPGLVKHVSTLQRVSTFLIDELQLHDEEEWRRCIPRVPWFCEFVLLKGAQPRQALAGDSALLDGRSPAFRLAGPAQELLRQRAARHCLSRLTKAAVDVPMATHISDARHLMKPAAVGNRVKHEPALTQQATQTLLQAALQARGPMPATTWKPLAELLEGVFLAVCQAMVPVRHSSQSDTGLVPLAYYEEVGSEHLPKPVMMLPESRWRDFWGRVAWQLHVFSQLQQAKRAAGAGGSAKVALAHSSALHCQAVEAMLHKLGIHASMSRQEVRQWVQGPEVAAVATERVAAQQHGHSPALPEMDRSLTEADLASGQAWVGMRALKQLGSRRGAAALRPGTSPPTRHRGKQPHRPHAETLRPSSALLATARSKARDAFIQQSGPVPLAFLP